MSELPVSPTPSPEVIREFNDRGTLWLLEDPELLRDLVRILDPKLGARLDASRAVRVNRSFIPADLQKAESDLIFRLPLLGAADSDEVWIYVLLEHQSIPDPLMPLRLYLYLGHLWDAQRREWDDRRLPAAQRTLHPVVPIVLYTGADAWTAPLRLTDLVAVAPELERFVPAWETLFLNLHRASPATLTQFAGAVGWALRVLQAERAPLEELRRVLSEAMTGLEGLSEAQSAQWLRVAWYLVLLVFHRRERAEYNGLQPELLERARRSKFSERVEVPMITMAQECEARGMRRALEIILRRRFGSVPSEVMAKIGDAQVEALQDWIDTALTAGSLAEVGIQEPAPSN